MDVTYTIACFDFTPGSELDAIGQSFTPSDQGPNGTGTPGTSTVMLTSFRVGYPTYALGERCTRCYVYNAPLSDPRQIGQAAGLLAMSGEFIDEVNLFGPGTYSRRFLFDPIDSSPLDVNTMYYLYFSDYQTVRTANQPEYDGGEIYNYDCEPDPDITLQFLAELTYQA